MKLKSVLTCLCVLILLCICTCAYADSGETGVVVIAEDDFSTYGTIMDRHQLLRDYEYDSGVNYGTGFVTNWSQSPEEYTVVDSNEVSYRRINDVPPDLYHLYNPNCKLYRRLEGAIDFDKPGERYIFTFTSSDTTPKWYTNPWQRVDFRYYLGSPDTYFGDIGGEGNTIVPQICVGGTQILGESDLTMSENSIATSTPRYIFELTVETYDGPDSIKLKVYLAKSEKPEQFAIETTAELGGKCEYIGFSPNVEGKNVAVRVYHVGVERYLPRIEMTDYFFVDDNNKCLYDATEITDSLLIKFKLKSTYTEPKNVSVFLALYDANRLLSVTKEDVTVPTASVTDYILVGYDGEEKPLPAIDTSSLRVKCFVWYN